MKTQYLFPSLIKLILPKFIINLIRYWNGYGFYRKKFETYSMALNGCGSRGYLDNELVNMVIRKCIKFNASFDKNIINTSLVPLYHLVHNENKDINNISIIDLGGGGGHAYTILKKIIPNNTSNVNYTVVETTAMVEQANKYIKENGLNFIQKIEELNLIKSNENISILYADSSIQYFEDVKKLLSEIVDLNPSYIIVARTPFLLEGESFYKIQRSPILSNGPGTIDHKVKAKVAKYPIFFMNVIDFEESLKTKYEKVYFYEEKDETFQLLLCRTVVRTYLYRRKIF